MITLPPQHFTLLVNDKCNLRCPYCFCRAERTGHEMSPETIARCLSFIHAETAAKGTRAAITLTGGEPSLSPDVVLALMAGARDDAWLRITTNGYAFPDRFLEALLPYRERLRLTVSYNGPADSSRGPGVEAAARATILKARGLGFQVNPSWTVDKETAAGLFDTARELLKLSADVRIKRNCSHNAWGDSTAYLENMARQLDPFVSLMAFERAVHGAHVSGPNKIESGLDLRCPGRQGTFNCQTGLVRNVVIDSHGSLFPCEVCAANGVLRLGDVWDGYEEPLHTDFVNAAFPEAGEHNNVCVYLNQIANGDFRDTSGCLNDKADRLLFSKRGKLHRQTRAFENLKRAYGHV